MELRCVQGELKAKLKEAKDSYSMKVKRTDNMMENNMISLERNEGDHMLQKVQDHSRGELGES